MCLIIDANSLSGVFAKAPDFLPVYDAVIEGKAIAVYGGELANEYAIVRNLTRVLNELTRQGKMRLLPDQAVRTETEAFAKKPLASDDPHILAIAKIGKVRLLCSHDKGLMVDFTNPKLLSPPGKVYQRPVHQHLITRHCKTKKRKQRTNKRRERKSR